MKKDKSDDVRYGPPLTLLVLYTYLVISPSIPRSSCSVACHLPMLSCTDCFWVFSISYYREFCNSDRGQSYPSIARQPKVLRGQGSKRVPWQMQSEVKPTLREHITLMRDDCKMLSSPLDKKGELRTKQLGLAHERPIARIIR